MEWKFTNSPLKKTFRAQLSTKTVTLNLLGHERAILLILLEKVHLKTMLLIVMFLWKSSCYLPNDSHILCRNCTHSRLRFKSWTIRFVFRFTPMSVGGDKSKFSSCRYMSKSYGRVDSLAMVTGCPRGVIVKAMGCMRVLTEFKLRSRYNVHFRTNTLGKGMNPLILLAMGYCSFRRMALALNNPRKLCY